VNQNTAEDLIVAGADAIGVGKELIPPDAIRLRKPDRIRELSHRFAGFVKAGRERLRAEASLVRITTTIERGLGPSIQDSHTACSRHVNLRG